MGEPSTFACPECHGVLLQMKEAGRVRFRCHTGHAYSAESLLAEISEGIENALWNAIRSMQEGALLMQELGTHVETHTAGDGTPLIGRGEQLMQQADTLREMVTSTVPRTNKGEEAANR